MLNEQQKNEFFKLRDKIIESQYTYLNDMQRKAVLSTVGPVLVLAGAGSGKTSVLVNRIAQMLTFGTVYGSDYVPDDLKLEDLELMRSYISQDTSGKTKTMTHRIAYLIKEKGVSPYSILAVTFTNKAAAEMRQRVEDLIGSGLNMWLTTFHSACMRILRQHIELLGYTKDFTIYDGTDQKTVLKECIKREDLDDKIFSVPYIQKIIGDCKDQGMSPQAYEESYSIGSKEYKVAKVYEQYEQTLKKNNALDFDDLILKTVELFEKSDEILAKYQGKFKYIMVDEYQDTNYMQYKFINLLAKKHKNICVVGDDDQCIYQWRGANIQNILGFEKDFPNTEIIKLEQNYRSTSNILEAAYNVIKNNSGRKPKKLWTNQNKGDKIRYYKAYTEKEEAAFIAGEIERLKGMNEKYSDFAVLYRTHAQARVLEDALRMQNIPYRIIGGLRFYDRKEVKDMMAYLKLVQNPVDDLSVKRVINAPKRGIGARTLEKIEKIALAGNDSLFNTMMNEEVLCGLSQKISKGITSFISVISKYQEEKDKLKVSEIYEGLLNETGYLRSLENQDTVEAKSRIEILQEFKSVIYDYENENEEGHLFDFLEKISLTTDIDNYDTNEDTVMLMTLHSAKGLEFPVVFMPGMEEGLFPGRRAFNSMEELEEERRLCYVGITRAKEKLYMMHAEQRMLYGRTEYALVSSFINEINQDLFEDTDIEKTKPSAAHKKQNFSSYEQMKYIKPKTKNPEKKTLDSDIKTGDKVRHKKFGEGMVVSVENKTATIAFENFGIKSLALDLAPLEKINA